MDTKKITCISCPLGCNLEVKVLNDKIDVYNNRCKRGEKYAIDEMEDPKRIVTSTIKVINGDRLIVSVKTDKEISKHLMLDAVRIINEKTVRAPIKIGDILIENVLGTDINIVATSNIDQDKSNA
jgi:CxxC motif-containing protein